MKYKTIDHSLAIFSKCIPQFIFFSILHKCMIQERVSYFIAISYKRIKEKSN